MLQPQSVSVIATPISPQCGTDAGSGYFAQAGAPMGAPGNSPALNGAPTFNSGLARTTAWGLGWSSENDQTLALNAGGSLTLTDGAGNQIVFYRVNASTSFPVYSSRINFYSAMTAVTASSGVPASIAERDPDGTTRLFSVAESTSLLRLARLTDRNGNPVNFTRDSGGRLTRMTDVHGRYFAFTYNSAGFAASLSDSAGRTSNYTYDFQGHRTSESGPLGTTSYAYDSQNRMTKISYPNGGVKNYTYDSQNRVATEDDGNGNNQLTYVYGSTSTAITDALGRATVNEYVQVQGIKKLSKVTDPSGGVTTFTYDANLNLASQTDPLGRVTRYTYDSQGNVIATQDASGGQTLASYEPVFNNPTSLTDPLNHVTNMSYDSQGDLTRISDPLAQATVKSYDSQGHVTRNQDPLSFTTTFSYDQYGALASVTDPLSRLTAIQNDALSRVTKNTDPSGKATNYSYDPASDLAQVKDALGNVTNYTYSPGRNAKLLTSVTDALGHTTSFGYDDLGRQTSVTNALGQTKYMTYDAKGNLTSSKNARGQTITYAYDSLDRLIKKTLPEGVINYTYDAAGNLAGVTHYNGSAIANTYDSLNRVTQAVQTLPNGYQATIGYGYDANGNRTSMTTPWGTFSYAYDALNRLTQITNPQNKVFGFAYDADGRRTSLNYPNGIITAYTYDHAGQILSITATRTSDNVVVSSQSYTYDTSGNRTSMTDWAGTHTYGYDSLNRLISASHPAASMLPILNETFSYDGTGNRSADTAISGYTYDSTNRLVQNSKFSYTYDTDGNLIAKKDSSNNQSSFSFDSTNEQTALTTPAGDLWNYKYDASGMRVEKSSEAASMQRFIYASGQLLAILDGSNNPISIFTNGQGIGAPLASRDSTGSDFFFHADALNSVVLHTAQAGAVVDRVAYTAYGSGAIYASDGSILLTPASGNLPLSLGQEFDFESGTSLFGPRYYDPTIGRFNGEDPIGFIGGLNLFLYSANNPILFSDPLGLAKCIYSISNHTLVCTSNDNSNTAVLGPVGIFSGTGPCTNDPACTGISFVGPIPTGEYKINDDPRQAGVYRLEPNPIVRWWEYYLGLKRNGFQLHPGGRSVGCITADKKNAGTMVQYQAIVNLLTGDSANVLTVTK